MANRMGWVAPVVALGVFVGIASIPFVSQGQSTPAWQQAAERSVPVTLGPAPAALPQVSLSAAATPIEPDGAPAAIPNVDSSRMADLVAAEDLRLRTLQHHINRITAPTVVPITPELGGTFDPTTGAIRGTPTLVLPGPATYTIGDLVAAGGAIPLTSGGGFLLVDNVLVGAGASLKLGGVGMPTLLMDSSATGFTSLVTWGGTLSLFGDSALAPLVIKGWDRTANKPAEDKGFGRPYIRAVGGELDLQFVHASNLGFWSGRTGGVAWTGITSRESTGKAISSQFIGDTYGAFTSRANNVQFTDDLFESNELDGLRLHRNTVNSTVSNSAAARNGGNGFVVGRGATFNVLKNDLAVNNRTNGFLINGQSLVNGASPSGSEAVAAVGIILQGSEAEANARAGILVEGGTGTIVRGNLVCGPITGIAVRANATNTFVANNEVRCGGRIAMSIGPSVTGTTLWGNTLSSARIGILIRNSSGVRLMFNRIEGVSLFGISVRGLSPGVVGNSNVIAGRGFQPIDSRSSAVAPDITTSDVTGWQHRGSTSLLAYLRYHPLLTTWLTVLVLVLISSVVIRLRRRPDRPYDYTLPWRPAVAVAGMAAPVPIAVAAAPAAAPLPSPMRTPVVAAAVASRPLPQAAPIVAAAPDVQPTPAPAPATATASQPVLWRPFAAAANGNGVAGTTEATSPPTGHNGSLANGNGAMDKAAEPSPAAGQNASSGGKAGREARRRQRSATVIDTADVNGVPPPATEQVITETKPRAPALTPAAPPRGQFWSLLTSGEWAADESHSVGVAEQEASA